MSACAAPIDDRMLFERAFNHAPIGMALVAPDRRILRANQALCDLLGYSAAELCGMTFIDITHPDDITESGRNVRTLYDNPEQISFRMEKRYFHRDGHVIQALMSASLICDGEGTPLYLIAHIEDITARKQAEAAREAGHVRLETLIAHLPDAILFEDEKRRVLLANRPLCDLFALPIAPEELVGMEGEMLAEDFKHLFARPEFISGRINELVRNRRRVLGETIEMADGRSVQRDYIPMWQGQNYYGHVWRFRLSNR